MINEVSSKEEGEDEDQFMKSESDKNS